MSRQLLQIWRLHKKMILWPFGCRQEQNSVRFVDRFQDSRYWETLPQGKTNWMGDWHNFQIWNWCRLMKIGKSRRLKNWANREIVVPCKRRYSRTCVRYRCSKITKVEMSEAKFICVDIAGERQNSVWYCNLVHEFVPMETDLKRVHHFCFVRFKHFWVFVAQFVLPRETESLCKRSFTSSNVDSRRKRQQWKSNERRS